jgi:hypothetical protein
MDLFSCNKKIEVIQISILTKHTFLVLAVFLVSLIDVDAMSCLCTSVAVDIGVVVSSNPYCCL